MYGVLYSTYYIHALYTYSVPGMYVPPKDQLQGILQWDCIIIRRFPVRALEDPLKLRPTNASNIPSSIVDDNDAPLQSRRNTPLRPSLSLPWAAFA